ncbi:MAG: hypothetical protein GYA18_00965 [Chloroflexi bacterium]|nr:hypothetical protein [Chloroflexota bacterium]
MQILETYPRMTILHHLDLDGKLWGTSRRTIWVRRRQVWEQYARFPFHTPRDYFGFSRLSARAFRADKCNIYVNHFDRVLGIRAGKVYAIEEGKKPTVLFSINGDCVLHGSLCEDAQGNIYFGEYFMNPAREPVRVWRVTADLQAWQIAYIFPAGSIRHVHGVYRDPFEDQAFWITVGDFKGECYIYKTTDGFRAFTKYGSGEQIWRAVRLFFTPTHVCWITDSNLEANHACRMDRRNGQLEMGMGIANSGWYGATTREGLHVAFTTVERGAGITSKFSEILISEDAFQWHSIYRFKKDRYKPLQVFKYGVISCPSGPVSNHDFYISGEGLVGLDGSSMRIDITNKAA